MNLTILMILYRHLMWDVVTLVESENSIFSIPKKDLIDARFRQIYGVNWPPKKLQLLFSVGQNAKDREQAVLFGARPESSWSRHGWPRPGIETTMVTFGLWKHNWIWLVVNGCHLDYFPIHIGLLSSSQLTTSYFSEGWPNHQPGMVCELENISCSEDLHWF